MSNNANTNKGKTIAIKMVREKDESPEKTAARYLINPNAGGALTIYHYTSIYGESDLPALMESLSDQSKAVRDGNLERAESMLIIQAHTLDAIFNDLARRAALNISQYLDAADKYLRLALKAQSQCRATLQTLGELKNPPIVYAKQANITNGPQQVNNGVVAPAPTHAGKNQNQPNELLEAQTHERLDTRAPSTASEVNQEVEAVATVDRAGNSIR